MVGTVKNICVIGGSGFIGSVLIRQLSEHHSLLNIDKRENKDLDQYCPTSICDVRDKDKLVEKLKGQEVAVLLAAEHADNVSPVSLYYDVNVTGTQNIVDAMDASGVKEIVFTSTVAVYGLNKDNPDENHPIGPFNDYGHSKAQAEEVLQKWASQGDGRTVHIIRPTVVFGEGNRGNVYNLLNSIYNKKFLMIGSGKNKKSMAYVENIATFIKYLIVDMEQTTSKLNVFNYTDLPDLDMNKFVGDIYKAFGRDMPRVRLPYWLGMTAGSAVDVLAKLTGKKLPISSQRVKKFCATTSFNSQKKKELGFVAPYSLEEGLRRTVEFDFK